MTGTITTRADVDRVASIVADCLTQLSDAEFWKFPGDDLLAAAWSGTPARWTPCTRVGSPRDS